MSRAARNLYLAMGALLLAGAAAAEPHQSKGQTIYVPVYSEVFIGNKAGRLPVRATVFFRNTDPKHTLKISSAMYHGQDGKPIEQMVGEPRSVAPLATVQFDIAETATRGGPAPSLIVDWKAAQPVVEPLVECVSATAYSQQGISILTRGKVIAEH